MLPKENKNIYIKTTKFSYLETGLKAVEISSQSFFSHGIVDPRFDQTKFNVFGPEAAITGTCNRELRVGMLIISRYVLS